MYRWRNEGLGATLDDLAAAIMRQESACSAPGVCVNNNPGNLRAYASGQPVDSRGIRIFPSYQTGYDALLSQERLNISKGLNLSEFFGGKPGVYYGYAPAADSNNPTGYAANVAKWLGIDTSVPLSSVINSGDVFSNISTPESGSNVAASDLFPAFDWSSDSILPADETGLSGAAWLGLGLGGAALLLWAIS